MLPGQTDSHYREMHLVVKKDSDYEEARLGEVVGHVVD